MKTITTIADSHLAPTHCGQPMRWTGSHASWTGKPGDGSEHHVESYRCDCGAEMRISLDTPC